MSEALNKSTVIIHFQPLEYYPPVQNLIRFLEEKPGGKKILVFTTKSAINDMPAFTTNGQRVKIISYGKVQLSQSKLTRLMQYFIFYSRTFLQLCIKQPQKILYIETLSSFPAWLYKKLIKPKVDILIHYHEYTSPQEYKNGMALARKFHQYERFIYPRAIWLSHTNQERMDKFIEDVYPVAVKAPHILPNYPPLSWKKSMVVTEDKKDSLMIVYVGAIGIETMYLKEFAEWVEGQEGRVQWHIYSQQDGSALMSMLAFMNARYIQFKGVVSYMKLAQILRNYDVGVILYKGHIPNYIYNAPNKLFEYAACGLDVWFPKQMVGSHPYITKDFFPKVVALDFEQLKKDITPAVLSHEGLQYRPSPYYCENVLPELCRHLN